MTFKLYRGFKDGFTPGEATNQYLNCPRRPLHTPLDIHLQADGWFFKKFGYKFRSQSLFCYGTMKYAADYGKVGLIEPIGEHIFCWSPKITDMYGEFMEPSNTDTIEKLLDRGEYLVFSVEDEDVVEKAIASGHEIMLWCKKYTLSEV